MSKNKKRKNKKNKKNKIRKIKKIRKEKKEKTWICLKINVLRRYSDHLMSHSESWYVFRMDKQ